MGIVTRIPRQLFHVFSFLVITLCVLYIFPLSLPSSKDNSILDDIIGSIEIHYNTWLKHSNDTDIAVIQTFNLPLPKTLYKTWISLLVTLTSRDINVI